MKDTRAPAGAACRLLGPVLVATWLAAVLPGQVTWTDAWTALPVRAGHAIAYDLARGRTVLFGGSATTTFADTWEWDGTSWIRLQPLNVPPARGSHALAYDLARGRTILFGGLGNAPGNLLADTWEWDGANWTQSLPTLSPPARSGHALAHDLLRGQTVLFGGVNAVGLVFADTWEWNGTSWVQRAPSLSPPPRQYHALAYDLARGRTVLFGGHGSASVLGDTWEWNGTNWSRAVPAQSPPPRAGLSLAFDVRRGRTVLCVGSLFAPALDTWEWDGINWTQRTAALNPSARLFSAMAYDLNRGRTVLFGGADLQSNDRLADTWEWDGSNWSQRARGSSPAARLGPALVYDAARARTVLFGGYELASSLALADTWEWDGTSWAPLVPATRPAARAQHALAFDAGRGRTLLFAGAASVVSPAFADTWEWDGLGWTQLTPPTSPPARTGHALAGDAARARIVLFGGRDASFNQFLADTWEWDGVSWLQQTPAQSPPGRCEHALAHDAARGRTVLFGGLNAPFTLLADTWEWDGANWSPCNPVHVPGARHEHAFAYDSARGRTVLFGGTDAWFGLLGDTWEWDGSDWTQRTPAVSTSARSRPALAFDARRARAVLFGGADPDTWEYGPIDPGTYTPFGTGCAGTAGTPTLAARDGLRLYPGNAVTVEIAPVPANTAVMLSFGLSRTSWGALSLPFDLSVLGMPGCMLYASADASVLLFAGGSVATLTIPIPDHQALAGLVLYDQAFVFDLPANAAGATASNAAEGRIGSK